MMENSGESQKELLVLGRKYLSEQEVKLLMLFRFVNAQRQSDLLRVVEVFSQLLD